MTVVVRRPDSFAGLDMLYRKCTRGQGPMVHGAKIYRRNRHDPLWIARPHENGCMHDMERGTRANQINHSDIILRASQCQNTRSTQHAACAEGKITDQSQCQDTRFVEFQFDYVVISSAEPDAFGSKSIKTTHSRGLVVTQLERNGSPNVGGFDFSRS